MNDILKINKGLKFVLPSNKPIVSYNNSLYSDGINVNSIIFYLINIYNRDDVISLENNYEFRSGINILIQELDEEVELFDYLHRLNLDAIIELGTKTNKYTERFFNKNAVQHGFKAIIPYSKERLNIRHILKLYNLDVLFIYNDETGEVIVYCNEGKSINNKNLFGNLKSTNNRLSFYVKDDTILGTIYLELSEEDLSLDIESELSLLENVLKSFDSDFLKEFNEELEDNFKNLLSTSNNKEKDFIKKLLNDYDLNLSSDKIRELFKS